MLKHKGTRVRLILGMALLAMLFLVGGLNQLDLLAEDRPLTFGQLLGWLWQALWRQWLSQPGTLFTTDPGWAWIVTAARLLIIVSLVLLPFSLIYLLLSPEARKQLLREFIRFTAFILVIVLFSELRAVQPDTGSNAEIPAELPPVDTISLPQFNGVFQERPSPWVTWTLTGMIALGVATLLVAVLWRWWAKRRREPPPIEQLAREAEVALDALEAGEDVRHIIIRCYVEMSRILDEARGIRRSSAATAREFEQYLQTRGLPALPVQRLTRLFERVRYSTAEPDAEDEQEAISSLQAIVVACRSAP